jgi:hypothetical protein
MPAWWRKWKSRYNYAKNSQNSYDNGPAPKSIAKILIMPPLTRGEADITNPVIPSGRDTIPVINPRIGCPKKVRK